MKTNIVGIIVLLLVAVAAVPVTAGEAGPAIDVREMRYYAGRVAQGKQVSHVFEIRNAGTETLVIDRVQPG